MLKYADTLVSFQEVPGSDITLCVDISGCPIHCEGCHSPWLAKDEGTNLTIEELQSLIRDNEGITCVAFMGGDADPTEVDRLAEWVHRNTQLKTCWYSGRQELSDKIHLWNFDFIKLGPYVEELGPLNSTTTNQRFYSVKKAVLSRDSLGRKEFGWWLKDITYKFWKGYVPTEEDETRVYKVKTFNHVEQEQAGALDQGH